MFGEGVPMPENLTDSSTHESKLLSRWTREFNDPALEHDYRNVEHTDSRRHERLGLILFILITSFFAVNDVAALWPGGAIAFPFLSRILMIAIALGYIAFTYRREYSPLGDKLAAVLVSVLGALIIAIESTRNPGYLGHIGLDVMFVMVIYLIIPMPLRYQVIVAVLFSLAEYILLRTLRTHIDPLSLFVVTVGLIVANIVGCTFSRRMGRFNRERYYALRSEREARAELEAALAEVNTLSGLLPICCVCKKIRDDSGYWSSVESYLHNHLHQQLTHGLCPECFTDQTRQLREAFGEQREEDPPGHGSTPKDAPV